MRSGTSEIKGCRRGSARKVASLSGAKHAFDSRSFAGQRKFSLGAPPHRTPLVRAFPHAEEIHRRPGSAPPEAGRPSPRQPDPRRRGGRRRAKELHPAQAKLAPLSTPPCPQCSRRCTPGFDRTSAAGAGAGDATFSWPRGSRGGVPGRGPGRGRGGPGGPFGVRGRAGPGRRTSSRRHRRPTPRGRPPPERSRRSGDGSGRRRAGAGSTRPLLPTPPLPCLRRVPSLGVS